MKIIYKFLSLIVLAGMFTSCEEQNNVYEGKSFASYEKTDYSATEGSGAIVDIPVYLNVADGKHDSQVAIDFTITSDNAEEGVNYSIIDDKKQFVFESGQYKDVIKVKVIDNTDEDGDKVMDIELSGSSNASLSLGTPGPTPTFNVATFIITDDDCALKLDEFTGTPGGVEWWGWSPNSQSGVSPYPNSMSFKLIDTDENIDNKLGHYWVENFAGTGMVGEWGEVTTTSYPIEMILDYTDPNAPAVSFITNPAAEIRHYDGSHGPQDVQVLNITDGGAYAYGLIFTAGNAEKTHFSTCNNTLHLEYQWVVATGTGDFGDFSGGASWDKAADLEF